MKTFSRNNKVHNSFNADAKSTAVLSASKEKRLVELLCDISLRSLSSSTKNTFLIACRRRVH
jgi:hypothetical protein